MIQVIAGAKGSGKTARLVDNINEKAHDKNNNIVCIQKGTRLTHLISHRVRLINIEEYPCEGYGQLLGLISGITAMDFDITHIYIDSIFKVAKNDDLSDFALFMQKLEPFINSKGICATIVFSSERDALPESIAKFC